MKKKEIYGSFGIMPKEEMLEVEASSRQLNIGVPKESSFQENRVSLTPESVGLLVQNGHIVIIEKGIGVSSNFTDKEYTDKGAMIAYSKEEVFKSVAHLIPPESRYIQPLNIFLDDGYRLSQETIVTSTVYRTFVLNLQSRKYQRKYFFDNKLYEFFDESNYDKSFEDNFHNQLIHVHSSILRL